MEKKSLEPADYYYVHNKQVSVGNCMNVSAVRDL